MKSFPKAPEIEISIDLKRVCVSIRKDRIIGMEMTMEGCGELYFCMIRLTKMRQIGLQSSNFEMKTTWHHKSLWIRVGEVLRLENPTSRCEKDS